MWHTNHSYLLTKTLVLRAVGSWTCASIKFQSPECALKENWSGVQMTLVSKWPLKNRLQGREMTNPLFSCELITTSFFQKWELIILFPFAPDQVIVFCLCVLIQYIELNCKWSMYVRSNFIVTFLCKVIKPRRTHALLSPFLLQPASSLWDFTMPVIFVPWTPISFLSYVSMLLSNTGTGILFCKGPDSKCFRLCGHMGFAAAKLAVVTSVWLVFQ